MLKTRPETVIQDYEKLMHLAEYTKELDKNIETLLKLNLTWTLYFPACSTEPWQLEGVVKAMQGNGYKLLPIENETVVTNPRKGAKLNKWVDIFSKYSLHYQPLTEVEWIVYKAKSELLALYDIFGEDGHEIPKMFIGKNVVHLPTMKCVHPDTEIILANGELLKIKDIIENVHGKNDVKRTEDGDLVADSNHDIISLSEEGRVKNAKASKFWKTPNKGKVFIIKTKTGRTVKVSGTHPFLTPKGWRQAKELGINARIAIPRKIRINGKSQELPNIERLEHKKIDIKQIKFRKGKKYSIKTQKKVLEEYLKGKTTTKIAKKMNMHYETVRKILLRYKVKIRWVKNWVDVPKKTSIDFWRWMGYFIAEGCANDCNGTMRFWWTNKNRKIVSEYKSLTKKVFGIVLKVKKGRGSVRHYYFDSNNLVNFFKKLGISFPIVASTKIVPKLLFKCPKNEIKAFLQTYLDGDGTVAKDGLHAVSKSKQLIKKIQWLFTRLGVVSFIKQTRNKASNGKKKRKNLYWKISVYGDDLVALSKYIKFHSSNKQKNLEKITSNRKGLIKKISNWDNIPVDPEIFRMVREGLGFSQNTSGKPGSVNSIENRYTRPTRRILNYFIKLFEKKDKKRRFCKQITYFKLINSDDIAWDYIDEIKQNESEISLLYDLSVDKTNNFIGNGIILHNTHGHTTITGAMKNAFGGLITKKRHHCHKKIHEVLVDLLIIQKEIHPGIFSVTDGTVCGNGPGPRTMVPVEKDYILASADQVAIDAISAKMMGFDPMKIDFIKIAHDKGLGCGDVDQIDVIGEEVKGLDFGFSTGKSPVIFMDQLTRKGRLSFIEPYLYHGPLFNMCVFGSETYHDKLWYPTTGRKIIKEFEKTKWGRLFSSYK